MFKDALQVEAMPGERWKLIAPLRYGEITVPAGFTTDLASIPRVLQFLPHFGVNGRSRRPAVLHDFLYELIRSGAPGVSKAKADLLFREALATEGLNRFTCAAYYQAVHLFGGR